MGIIAETIENKSQSRLVHPIQTIHVTWKPINSNNRIILGVLKREGEAIRFKISGEINIHDLQNELNESKLIQKLNESQDQEVLIYDLLKRIPNKLKKDGLHRLKFWGADNDTYDDFDVLGLTQGRMVHDDFEFLAEFPAEEGMTFVTNLSYVDKVIASKLSNFEQLFFKPEPEHLQDPKAIAVFIDKRRKQRVGYIKSYHNLFFHECLKKGIQPMLNVKEVQIFNTIQSQVYIKVTA